MELFLFSYLLDDDRIPEGRKTKELRLVDASIPRKTLLFDSLEELLSYNKLRVGTSKIYGIDGDTIYRHLETDTLVAVSQVSCPERNCVKQYDFVLSGSSPEFLESIKNQILMFCEWFGYRRENFIGCDNDVPELIG